jgi:hypothetical protein
MGFIHCFTLCLSEVDYKLVVRELNVPYPSPYYDVTGTANAWVKEFESVGQKSRVALVCVKPETLEKPLTEILGYLVHEAVHIYQFAREYIGERHPGIEFEAYMIQKISERLIEELRVRRPKLFKSDSRK